MENVARSIAIDFIEDLESDFDLMLNPLGYISRQVKEYAQKQSANVLEQGKIYFEVFEKVESDIKDIMEDEGSLELFEKMFK